MPVAPHPVNRRGRKARRLIAGPPASRLSRKLCSRRPTPSSPSPASGGGQGGGAGRRPAIRPSAARLAGEEILEPVARVAGREVGGAGLVLKVVALLPIE